MASVVPDDTNANGHTETKQGAITVFSGGM
jgi:hypothetical protein